MALRIIGFSSLALAAFLFLPTQVQAKSKPLFERIGGLPAVEALVAQTLQRILKDPRIKEYFKGADLERVGEHFVTLACKATGGPCKYEGRSMKESHEGMHVTNSAFDAVMEHILFTMRKLKVPGKEQGEIMKIFNALRKDIVEVR